MNTIHIYFKVPPKKDRFIPGDRYIFSLAAKLLRKKRISSLQKVTDSLSKGFDELGIKYDVNLPFKKIKPGEPVVSLGLGKYSLKGYNQPNPIIAGIGLMTHPYEWPTLFEEYPVAKYLQHSAWTRDIYVPYFGDTACAIWPAGIDTERWIPKPDAVKVYDLLIYNKIMWDKAETDRDLRSPIMKRLDELGITYTEIRYGEYTEEQYFTLLQQCKAMLFLCEHESQGLACCEALSMNVPVLAWDQGYWLDPNRFVWNNPVVPATSIPCFDERCGMWFKDIAGFENIILPFINKVKNNGFNPREYILENLTLKNSAQKMLDIIYGVYS